MNSNTVTKRSPRRPYQSPRIRRESEPERLGHLLPDAEEKDTSNRD